MEKHISKRLKRRIDKIKNLINSIRTQVFIIIVVVMIVPVTVCNIALESAAMSNYLTQKEERLNQQNTMLKNCVISESYMEKRDSSLVKAELNRISSGYDGRIEIINNSFEILTDTYNQDAGKTSIAEPVLKSMEGESVSDYNGKENYIEFAVPINVTVDANEDQDQTEDQDQDSKTIVGVIYFRYSTQDLEEFRSSIEIYAVSFDAIIIFLAIVLAYVFSKYISNPFTNAEKSLVQITNGDAVTEIDSEGYTEMQKMYDAINHLLDKLSKQEQSRQEFVSNVSHELKTPITSMKVLADSLIGQENVPEELYQEFLTDIGKEIDRENDIITDLLSLVRIDNGRVSLNIGQFNINDLVELTLKRVRPIAATKNIDLVFESFRPVIADVDDVKMTIVISNLVENAIKYNVNDGWVRVSLNADHQYFYVKVADSGIGIDEEDQNRVFERFFRVDKARSRETGGTGLGLAITRNIVLMHKGDIKVYSKKDEGTTFTVRIPLKYIV